ncbi:MAG: hypothetical protein ACU843_09880 [Gammaproteobacteria bacterium]
MKGNFMFYFVLCTVLVMAMPNAQATHPIESDLSDFVQKADLIFEGTVVNVEYRSSDVASQDQVALPHTFVTYQIETPIKGRSEEGNSLTLRFRGGPDEQGNTLMIPGAPLFEVGDHDMVFVKGNGTDIVPLVGWSHGRFRIVDDKIYGDSWEEVWLSGQGQVDYGKMRPGKTVVTHVVGVNEFSFETSENPTWTPAPGSQRARAPGFRKYISDMVGRHFTQQALNDLAAEKSMNIRDEFHVNSPRPVAAPSVPVVDDSGSQQAIDPLEGE